MVRSCALPLLAVLSWGWCAPTVFGLDAEAKKVLHEQADAAMAEGKRLQSEFQDSKGAKTKALIEAALAFGRAHALYQRAGDEEALVDSQASLFWCRKQMTEPTLRAYNRRLEGKRDGEEAAAPEERPAASTPEAPRPSPADLAMAKAEAFEKAHGDDLLAVAQTWSDVARRFADTEQGQAATLRATAAREIFATKLRAGEVTVRTRFQVDAAAEAKKGVSVPSEAEQKRAAGDLRKSLGALWGKRDKADRQKFLDRLLQLSSKKDVDPAECYVALNEAAKVAEELEAYDRLVLAYAQLGEHFQGIDVKAQTSAALKHNLGKPVAQALLTLLTDPKEKLANTLAGKAYAFQYENWDEGLALLINGNDQELRAVAVEEYLTPTKTEAIVKLADAWYALGKRRSEKDLRMSSYARAQRWYQRVLPSLTGAERERVVGIQAELDKVLPLDLENVKWDNLTETQWNRLKGAVVTVEIRVDRTMSGIVLRPGERVRVVPHPTDTWTLQTSHRGEERSFSYLGSRDSDRVWYGDGVNTALPWASLTMVVGTGKRQPVGIATGPGPLSFEPNRPSEAALVKGSIRVKILPVTDE